MSFVDQKVIFSEPVSVGILSDNRVLNQKSAALDKVFQNTVEIIEDFADIKHKSIFWVFKENFNKTILYFLGRALPQLTSDLPRCSRVQYHFYNLIYCITKLSLVTDKDSFFKALKAINNDYEISSKHKLLKYNHVIAKYISKNSSMLKKHDLKKLTQSYLSWVKSLNDTNQNYIKNLIAYIDDSDNNQYVFYNGRFLDITKINLKSLKLIEIKNKINLARIIIVIATAIALGLIPAVLSASACGGIICSILIVGIPSIIVNLMLYNDNVKSLIKDLIRRRLYDGDKKKGASWRIVISFILAFAAGVVYGALAFLACSQALSALLLYFLPKTMPWIGYAVCFWLFITASLGLTVCTIFSTAALYYGSLLEIFETLQAKIEQGFYSYKNILLITNNLKEQPVKILFKGLLAISASYLTFMECALLYSAVAAICPIASISYGLALLTVPANFIFTQHVYSFISNSFANIPTYYKNIKNNFKQNINKTLSNPVLFYEAIMSAMKAIPTFLLVMVYANGSARGLVDEVHKVKFMGVDISMNNKFINGLTQAAEISDSAGAVFESFEDSVKQTHTWLYEPLTTQESKIKNSKSGGCDKLSFSHLDESFRV